MSLEDPVNGPAIDPQGLSASEINQQVEAWIEEKVKSLPIVNTINDS